MLLSVLLFVFAVLFESPLTAAAVAAGAIATPIIIHLLNRRRFKIVPWAAMRFLLAAQRKNSRRMRVEQIILLVLRCLLLALLLAAMLSVTPWAEAAWRWAFPEAVSSRAASKQRTHKVLVIDGSLSMDLRRGEASVFARALQLGEQVVKDSSGTDAFSVILMSDPPRRIVSQASEDPDKVIDEIRKLHLPHGNADLIGTLAAVDGILEDSPGKYRRKEVYFLTDLQKSTWVAQQPAAVANYLTKIKSKADSFVVHVGGDAAPNLAVTSLRLLDDVATTGRISTFVTTLQQYGTESQQTVTVKFLLGKARASREEEPCSLREIKKTSVKLERGQETPVAFSYNFQNPGDYLVQVEVEHDGLMLDDVRSAVVSVRKELPVLIVNGKADGTTFEQSAGWLQFALRPTRSTAPPKPRVVSQPGWEDETEGNLTPFDCVFFCDLPSVREVDLPRLERHVRQGGGAVFFLGNQVQPGEYNRLLYKGGAGLLPASLVSIQEPTQTHNFQLALEADSDRMPPMEAFRGAEDRAALLMSRFSKFYRVGEAASGIKPRRVLSFVPVPIAGKEEEAGTAKAPPGGPAILEWNPPGDSSTQPGKDGNASDRRRMRGRVILVTTTANTEWNNLPPSPSFPALMHELLYFASAGRLQEQSVEVGEPLELYLPTVQNVEAKIVQPDETARHRRTEDFQDASALRWTETDVSGLYRVTLGEHPREHLFTVNVPILSDQLTSESDLARTTSDELQQVYPQWNAQVVTDLKEIEQAALPAGTIDIIYDPLGTSIAHWMLIAALIILLLEVVLAWQFGHYSGVAAPVEIGEPRAPQANQPTWGKRVLVVLPWVLFAVLGCIAFVLGHAAFTGDFLGFLPDGMRHGVERWVGVPTPAAGEDSHWRLDYTTYLWDDRADLWLVPLLALAGVAYIGLIYLREGRDVPVGQKLLLVAMRTGVLLLLLVVFLPQINLWFDRQGWPDVVVLIDDSHSMSATDEYGEAEVKEAADKLAQLDGLDEPTRLKLAQALLSKSDTAGLDAILQSKKIRLHVYHCSGRAHQLESVTEPSDLERAVRAVRDLQAAEENDTSQLGKAVRQVINDFRGSSLAAIVMLTDGVTTEGEDLIKVSTYSSQMGVPLYFIGVGDAHDVRDVYLDNLRAEDSVYVNDRLIFEVDVIAQGYPRMKLPVTLREKGKEDGPPLHREEIQTDPDGRPIKVRLVHQPTEQGEKTYVIEVPLQDEEVEQDNNRLERQVTVLESKQIKVLYVEGYRRYEYHYLKTLLERESQRIKGNKSVDLKVRLLESDPDFAIQDQSAIAKFPTKKELESYDVVILGDVDPRPRDDNRVDEFLQNLAEFVLEKGGGLLMIAGERYSPHLYKASPLRDVLPVDVIGGGGNPDRSIVDSFRPQLTPAGRIHPIFRFSPDEKENDDIWTGLREMFWYAEGYRPKPAAEALAVHPSRPLEGKEAGGGDDPTGATMHPLVLQQFAGAGRCLFMGFHETWRWGYREDMKRFNQFWIQMVRYLARSRQGSTRLWLDRQTPYRRGDPIKIFVRFPDDRPPPTDDVPVTVLVERRPFDKPTEMQTRKLELSKMEGTRATYEGVLTQTPEGMYRFWLNTPLSAGSRPRAECKVVAPPGEMYGLRLNRSDLMRAAEQSGGHYYSLATVHTLPQDLPEGKRTSRSGSSPPWGLWSHWVLYLIALTLLAVEWIIRKQRNLL